jgi:hypothetical protein
MPIAPFCPKHVGKKIMTKIFVPAIAAITLKKKTPTSLGQFHKRTGQTSK